MKYSQCWGAISGVVVYDSNYESWAGKARVDVTVNDAISLFVMAGYGSDSDVTDPNTGHSFFKLWDGSWAVWGGASYKFNEKASFNVQASYDDGKTFGLAANVAYDVVPGFTVTAEVDYFNKSDSDWHGDSDGLGGIPRLPRSFYGLVVTR